MKGGFERVKKKIASRTTSLSSKGMKKP